MQFQYQCQCQHFMQQEKNYDFFQQFSPQISRSQTIMPTNYEQQQQYGPNNNYAAYQPFFQYQYPFMHNGQQDFITNQRQQQCCYKQPNQCAVPPRWV